MAVLPIIVAPDPRLKIKARPVDAVDADVRKLMDDMLDSMYAANGIGLAAPQVGDARRVIVVDVSRDTDARKPMFLANPQIIGMAPEDRPHEEGCLSLPEHYAEVIRPDWVRVRYLDRDNEIREINAEGILSTCIQHEIDHLDGVLFVDHVSALKRNMILRKLQKAKKLAQTSA
ncbi:MAG: peptide deformylase [Rhodospirillales bacterium]